jgi:hypothetical protein
MESLGPTLAAVPSADSDKAAKRRKLRRGTRSCWDCKRRKVRCIFASPEDAVCSNCRRRGATCVGQDLPEELAPARDEQISDRIIRVEALVNNLARQANATGGPSTLNQPGLLTPSYNGSEAATVSVGHGPRRFATTRLLLLDC